MKQSFEKLYEKALLAAQGQTVLHWQKSRAFHPHLGHGGPDTDVTMRTTGVQFTAFAWRGGYLILHNWTNKIVEQDRLNDKSLLVAESAAELTLRTVENRKATPSKVQGALDKLNEKLSALTANKYTIGVPLLDVIDITKEAGFWISEDDVPIISTTKGREILHIGFPGSKREMIISMSWYRMDSGRYETVAYAN